MPDTPIAHAHDDAAVSLPTVPPADPRDVDEAVNTLTELLGRLPANTARTHAQAHLRTTAIWAEKSLEAGPDPVPAEAVAD